MHEYILTQSEVEALMRPIKGEGGWQSLLLALQAGLHSDILYVDDKSYKRVARYLSNSDPDNRDWGGWQQRIPQDLRLEAYTEPPTQQEGADETDEDVSEQPEVRV